MPILKGVVAHPDDISAALGRTFDAVEVLRYSVTGARCLVIRDTVDETMESGIHIPRTVAERMTAENGRGLVIAAGPMFGKGPTPHPVGVLCDDPADILLKRVVMLQWSGKVLKKGNLEDEWGGDLLILTDRDIQLVEIGPDGQ